jgi:hypothetical protein
MSGVISSHVGLVGLSAGVALQECPATVRTAGDWSRLISSKAAPPTT